MGREFTTVIAGSRSITDTETVYEAIRNAPFEVSTVLSGGADGVDSIGEKWAEENNIPINRYLPEDYESDEEKPATLVRNDAMAEDADALIAVWNGNSSGTEYMIEAARSSDIPERRIKIHRTDIIGLSNFG